MSDRLILRRLHWERLEPGRLRFRFAAAWPDGTTALVHRPRDREAPAMTASDRAIRALEALGGTAPAELVAAHLRAFHDPLDAELVIGLAVALGRVERLELEDGRPGLRLLETREEAPA